MSNEFQNQINKLKLEIDALLNQKKQLEYTVESLVNTESHIIDEESIKARAIEEANQTEIAPIPFVKLANFNIENINSKSILNVLKKILKLNYGN